LVTDTWKVQSEVEMTDSPFAVVMLNFGDDTPGINVPLNISNRKVHPTIPGV
jgi:hypothetical protein